MMKKLFIETKFFVTDHVSRHLKWITSNKADFQNAAPWVKLSMYVKLPLPAFIIFQKYSVLDV